MLVTTPSRPRLLQTSNLFRAAMCGFSGVKTGRASPFSNRAASAAANDGATPDPVAVVDSSVEFCATTTKNPSRHGPFLPALAALGAVIGEMNEKLPSLSAVKEKRWAVPE